MICTNEKELPQLKKKICSWCNENTVRIHKMCAEDSCKGLFHGSCSKFKFDNYPNICDECFDEQMEKIGIKND